MNTLDEIIIAYRKLIEQRYQYDVIKENYDLPEDFGPQNVTAFRNYFLEYLYPHPSKRKQLDEAFQQLDTYTKSPEKLFRILLDSTSLIFKYGRHLRKILKSGMQALKAFRTANSFEKRLTTIATNQKVKPPYSKEDIHTLILRIPQSQVESFIDQNVTLFNTLHDRALVKKITHILEDLIIKMKKRPDTYSVAEVAGLEMGLELIVEGDKLFDSLSPQEQKELLQFATEYERKMIREIYSAGSS